ncbi:MAG: 4-hydroxyphenylpyruvate dioxygenase [Leptolyngbyaceae bacterium]|nr:4-hydroxyphenylpyruvate dioxygenase [Leptolyngbyaceae bacterium]
MNVNSVTFFLEDLTIWTHWFISVLGFLPQPQHGLIPHLSLRAVERYLKQHPCGVSDVGFSVTNIERAYTQAIHAGAEPIQAITTRQLSTGTVKQAIVSGWGDLRHTLTEYCSDEMPEQNHPISFYLASPAWESVSVIDTGDALAETVALALPIGEKPDLLGIDHVVLNVPDGEMLKAAAWYERAFGFRYQQTFSIQTPRSGLHSVVMAHPDGNATLPINEPSSPNSQIQEFLGKNRGAGVQHIALSTQRIIQTVGRLREKGIAFLSVPDSYYEQLPKRSGFRPSVLQDYDWGAIAQQGILADWKTDVSDGLLFQIFTEPIFKEPTFFFEIIQRQSTICSSDIRPSDSALADRRSAQPQQPKGFGEGNFQALFEAIEREQMKRGSLPLNS